MDIPELNEELKKFLTEEELQSIDPLAMLEMATVVSDRKGQHIIKNISINPDATRNWFGEEYFKVYDNLSIGKAKKLTRIKFGSPEYVIHYNSNWVLNNKEKKDLIKFLKEPNKRVPGINNNWQYGILMFNMEANQDFETQQELIITTEEQRLLDKNDPRKYYLPIDLEMPNYLEL